MGCIVHGVAKSRTQLSEFHFIPLPLSQWGNPSKLSAPEQDSSTPASTSRVSQLVKILSAVWEAWVLSLGWEDYLKKGKATHSSILAWIIPWIV